jgi:hypothetical protein
MDNKVIRFSDYEKRRDSDTVVQREQDAKVITLPVIRVERQPAGPSTYR